MEFRKAAAGDLDAIAAIYDRIHTREEAGETCVGWVRGIYPTRATAEAALAAGDLFVLEDGGTVAAAARINQEQVPEYRDACWQADAPDSEVMVLHTLTVDPARGGGGYGTAFVAFYEDWARSHGCPHLRMDTNVKNARARRLYAHLGYREAGMIPCVFNGITGVQLVCLEKNL